MARLRVEIVAGTIGVGQHRRDEVAAMLPAIGLSQLDPGDLGDGIGLVGRLERSSQERLFRDRLGGEPWIDAARAQEEELLDALGMGGLDEVHLDSEIVVQKVGRESIVGQDSSDPRRGHEHGLGPVCRHPGSNRPLVAQIQMRAVDGQDFARLRGQAAHDRAADHAAMARYINPFAGKRVQSAPLCLGCVSQGLEIGPDHLARQFASGRAVAPAELVARLGGVADEQIDLGRAEIAAVDLDQAASILVIGLFVDSRGPAIPGGSRPPRKPTVQRFERTSPRPSRAHSRPASSC